MRLPCRRVPSGAPLLALAVLLVWPASPAATTSPPATAGATAATVTALAAETTPVGRWPLRPEPEVLRRFDPPASPWAAGHRGVDLAGRPDQPVLAALPGRVTYAAPLAGRGVVVVDHGDTRTTYEPVRAGVRVGEVVAAGDRLGRLEAVGSHCVPGVCLHWGWIRGEDYLDPLRLVGLGPVRLLPLDGSSPMAPSTERAVVPAAGELGSAWRWPGQARGWAWW